MTLTASDKAQIDALYAQGKSIFQVHLETGVSADIIRAYLKATGQTRPAGRGKAPALTPQQSAKIVSLRADGMTWAAIARRFGVSVVTVIRAEELHRTGAVRMGA